MPNVTTPENFEDIWKNLVEDPLKQISIANGYENDPCWIEGWLIYYAHDIARGVDGLSFPSIGARPGEENIVVQRRNQRHDPYQSHNTRSFVIEAGFDGIAGRDDLTKRMESLLRDIKKAIGTVKTSNLTLTRVNFDIPQETLDYAFLVVEGNIAYNETWGN
ncbi:hypothetical protein [Alteromonas phage JH01]|mgnify:CR=1 FL=1|nr:hypothetical protein [Alteromonas phage JH01]